jgi:hypothetical protein
MAIGFNNWNTNTQGPYLNDLAQAKAIYQDSAYQNAIANNWLPNTGLGQAQAPGGIYPVQNVPGQVIYTPIPAQPSLQPAQTLQTLWALPANPKLGDVLMLYFDGQNWQQQQGFVPVHGDQRTPTPLPPRHDGFTMAELEHAQDLIEELQDAHST